MFYVRDMKHTILLLSTLLCVLPLQAQRVRNKPFDVTLRDYTIDEVVQLFGKPVFSGRTNMVPS